MSGFFNMDSPVMRFLSRVCDLMILNFMCLICCIPIVTIGASVTALYSVTLKMVRGGRILYLQRLLKGFQGELQNIHDYLAASGGTGPADLRRLQGNTVSARQYEEHIPHPGRRCDNFLPAADDLRFPLCGKI